MTTRTPSKKFAKAKPKARIIRRVKIAVPKKAAPAKAASVKAKPAPPPSRKPAAAKVRNKVAAPPKGKIKYDSIPKVEKKRIGRPHKDGSPPRERAKSLPIKVRREIKKMLLAGDSVATIQYRYRRYQPSYTQIDNIKRGRTKTVKTKRSDAHDNPAGADVPVTSGKSITELLREGLLTSLEGVNMREGMKPADRIALLEKASRVDRHVKASELEAHIKRADARIIAAVIRRYEPEATDARIVAIYREELAKIQQDLGRE